MNPIVRERKDAYIADIRRVMEGTRYEGAGMLPLKAAGKYLGLTNEDAIKRTLEGCTLQKIGTAKCVSIPEMAAHLAQRGAML